MNTFNISEEDLKLVIKNSLLDGNLLSRFRDEVHKNHAADKHAQNIVFDIKESLANS